MSVFASLLSAALAPHLASLDLCADEYLLAIAPRPAIASVSHLGHDPHDSALAARARGLSSNRGTLESLIGSGAKTLLSTRPLGRLDADLAARLGMQVVTLETGTPDTVANAVAIVGKLSGGEQAARRWMKRLDALRSGPRPPTTRALWIGPGGVGLSPSSPTARWLALAGIVPEASPAARGKIEAVLASDAPLLLESRYDTGNFSLASAWIHHPLVARDPRPRIEVDGRRFTCSGPLMLAEIERLRRQRAR